MSHSNLGFSQSPKSTRIFINKEGDCIWYLWDSLNLKKIPIETEGINCLLIGIHTRETKSDYGDSVKLDFTVQADKLYDLCAGKDTWFAKTLVATLDSATDEQLTGALHIAPNSPKDSKKAVFARVYDKKGQLVICNHQWKSEDGRAIPFDLDAAIERINFRLNAVDRAAEDTPDEVSYVTEVEHNFQEPIEAIPF
jgi:hypothetical protein